jgi:hypothetical protein
MEQKKHIEMMRLINVISNGKNLPGTARDAAVRYACHVAADTQLQAQIRERNSKSLAERDIKRCTELAAKQGVKAVTLPPPVEAAPAPVAPVAAKKRRTPEEIAQLEKHGILVRVSGGPLEWSVKGEAWKEAGEPPLDKFVFVHKKSVEPEAAPLLEDNLRDLIPYLDVNLTGGFVTFSRVPSDKKYLVEKLRTTGILGRMNVLTDKGTAWLKEAA